MQAWMKGEREEGEDEREAERRSTVEQQKLLMVVS
jgi:hypothetical protein